MRALKLMGEFSRGTVALLVVLLALMIGAIIFAVSVWTAEQVELPPYIWAALAGGVFFSLVVGCGLMALVFYSSRAGYDDAAHLDERRDDAPRAGP